MNGKKDTALPRGEDFVIRTARETDAKALLGIYAPYVTDTCITFEYTVPGEADFARRIRDTLARFPYLCAVRGEEILGYCYASPFHVRRAYQWTAESSIYLRWDMRGRGIGSALQRRLEEILILQGITGLNACITWPNPESIAFHERHGFALCAHFTRCGYKMGRWLDMVWMEKELLPRIGEPAPPVPFPEIAPGALPGGPSLP